MFRTFTRTWWRLNSSWPCGAGPKKYDDTFENEYEARAACKAYNDTHEPGQLSLKMEYEEI